MNLADEILINKHGQDLIDCNELVEKFDLLDFSKKRIFLNDLLYLIKQSKAKDDDIELAILESKLKPTYTPCILLRKGVANHHLQKIIELPEAEMDKAFLLLLSLFKIAYRRRFANEKNAPNKWWYWDLSDASTIDKIIKMH